MAGGLATAHTSVTRNPCKELPSDTGLVLAIELARRGVPFHLVDRHPEFLGRDRAVVVESRSLEVFDGLGLANTFLERGRIIHNLALLLGGTRIASIGLGGLDLRQRLPPPIRRGGI